MRQTFQRIRELVARGDIAISAHGYDELAADGILVREVVASIEDAFVLEDYPDYPQGLCVLVLQRDAYGQPIHVVWGIAKETSMTRRRQTKLVREGEYVAEVEIELIDTGEGWSPYLSLTDAQKLDDVREALRRGDIVAAGKLSRVFRLTPVTV
jgi:Domain of unknown function (DUF4258)